MHDWHAILNINDYWFNVLKFGIKSDITIIKIELVAEIDPMNRFEMVMVSRSAYLSDFPR